MSALVERAARAHGFEPGTVGAHRVMHGLLAALDLSGAEIDLAAQAIAKLDGADAWLTGGAMDAELYRDERREEVRAVIAALTLCIAKGVDE